MEGCQKISEFKDDRVVTKFYKNDRYVATRIIGINGLECEYEYWYVGHTPARANGLPAEIWRNNGQIVREYYYVNGKVDKIIDGRLAIREMRKDQHRAILAKMMQLYPRQWPIEITEKYSDWYRGFNNALSCFEDCEQRLLRRYTAIVENRDITVRIVGGMHYFEFTGPNEKDGINMRRIELNEDEIEIIKTGLAFLATAKRNMRILPLPIADEICQHLL